MNGSEIENEHDTSTTSGTEVSRFAQGLVGAVVGAAAGYLIFGWCSQQGFYAIILPPALSGLACGALARQHSVALGIICVIVGLAASIVGEWRYLPFVKDGSFSYFLSHLHELRPITMILVGVGCGFGFYLGRGHNLGGSGRS